MTRFVGLILTLTWMSFSPVALAETSAQDHLARAMRLANAYNWADAGPDFVEAERLFIAQGDQELAYQARLGKMRSTIEHGALPEVIVQLAEDLETLPFLQTNKRLRMFCLIVKGDFDGESEHAAMARDWEEVHALAKELGDKRWEHRAMAQLGIAAYYNADLEGARQRVGAALFAAHALGDKPGEMLALSILANGLNYTKLYGQSLPYAEQAIKLAKEDPDIGYPYVAHQPQLTALIGTSKLDAAQTLADEMLAFASERRGHALEAAVLIQEALLARARKDDARAIALLNQSIQIAIAGGYLSTPG